MSNFLYVNSLGQPHRSHSYSAGLEFEQCPYKYYLKRVLGWKERDNKAALKFGRSLESALQFYHDTNAAQDPVEEFKRLWTPYKDEKLVYTARDKEWESLDRAGREMMQIYVAKQKKLPIPMGALSVFQRTYEKELFPLDPNYNGIVMGGKPDIISYVEPDHPLLPAMEWHSEYGPLRPGLWDIKTSGIELPDTPGISALDKQLRVYSWLTGITTVGLLWFRKTSHTMEKGSRVTVLENFKDLVTAQEVWVAAVTGDGVFIVTAETYLEEMEKAQGRREDGSLDTRKDAKERKQSWLVEHATLIPAAYLSRQRVQFDAGIVSPKSANEAGEIAGRQVVQIVNSWKNQMWPNQFGIRFPHDDRNDAYFRAFVLGDMTFRDENFERRDGEDFNDEEEIEDVQA